MAAITALLMLCGNVIGGQAGLMIALVMAVVMNVGTYWFSDKLVLRMTRAIPLEPSQAPALYEMTERLSQRAGIPMPKLYLIPDASPNAFATGRNPSHSAVAVNQGLLDLLSQDEVEGVVAHEIAHIRNRDTLISTVAATFAGAIGMLGNMAMFAGMFAGGDQDRPNPLALLVMAIGAPIAATLIQLGISRTREYSADRTAAELVGRPDGLQNALLKLERGSQLVPNHSMSTSTAHMCIVNPLTGRQAMGMMQSLFSTHPPIAERVRRLEETRSA